MAAKTKVKEVKLTDEEKYAKAKELTQAVNCLTRDKERAVSYILYRLMPYAHNHKLPESYLR